MYTENFIKTTVFNFLLPLQNEISWLRRYRDFAIKMVPLQK